jgi:hypothetical protein
MKQELLIGLTIVAGGFVLFAGILLIQSFT